MADLNQWLAIATGPAGNVVLAFFIWKMQGDVKKNTAANEELKKALYENGFPTKAEVKSQGDRIDLELERIKRNLHELRNFVTGMQRPDRK